MTETTVAVVPEAEALDDAYSAGFDRFKAADGDGDGDPTDAVSHFKETAAWANSVARAFGRWPAMSTRAPARTVSNGR